MNQLVFTWNEVTSHCPSIQYVITATNCGVCPCVTKNTTISCLYFNISTKVNFKCMLAVQTEVCGSILGEMSDYSLVNLIGE